MSSGSQHPTTNEAGIPVASDEHSLSVGADGPIVMRDHYLMEQMAAFNREMIRLIVCERQWRFWSLRNHSRR